MDLLSNSDADFDAYWEEEARNPHRNRIRIGRQYQVGTIPPKLKKGESDNRKLEELETLTWCPGKHKLTNEQLDDYFAIAKALSLFSRTMQNDEEASLNGDSSSESDEDDEGIGGGDGNGEASVEKAKKKKSIIAINSTPLPNTSTSTLKACGNRAVPTWHSKISSIEDPVLRLQVATSDMAEYVTYKHPEHHDPGCDIPAPSISGVGGGSFSKKVQPTATSSTTSTEDWSSREAYLFAKALEVCGKNFSAIKKTFLPWKPVKSIIEHYYKKGPDHDDQNDEEAGGDPSKRRQFLSVNSTKSLLSAKSTNSSSSATQSKSNGSSAKDSCEQKPSNDDLALDITGVTKSESLVVGEEIKPLRAKPILASEIVENQSAATTSSMGSLKFYMDGQLVLKLNAKQPAVDHKCQWIESQDTPKIVKPHKKPNSKKHQFLENEDSRNSTSRTTTRSEDTEASMDSSDDESLESSESKSLPSPPSSSGTPRKAKVKVENNCLVPLPSPSPTSMASSNSSIVTGVASTTFSLSTCAPSPDQPQRKTDSSSLFDSFHVKQQPPKSEPVSFKRDHHSHNSHHFRPKSEEDLKLKRHKTSTFDTAVPDFTPRWLSNGLVREKYQLKNHSKNYQAATEKTSAASIERGNRIAPTAHSSSRVYDFSLANSNFDTSAPLNHHHSSAPVDLTRKSTLFSPREGKSVSPPVHRLLDLSSPKDRVPPSKKNEKAKNHFSLVSSQKAKVSFTNSNNNLSPKLHNDVEIKGKP